MQLTTTQQTIVNSKHPHILALACPGSGKTRTFIERIRRLIVDGVNPRAIIAITFTNAAAREILTRLQEPDAPKVTLGFCGTLHSFMLRILRRYSDNPDFGIMDEDQAEALLLEVVAEMKYKGPRPELINLMLSWRKHKVSSTPTKAELVVSAFYHRLKQENLLTFDLLLTEGLKLVTTLQDRWPWVYLFVDEYQDSGDLDSEIYDAIPCTNKFFIGDANQSVFGFRGGRVKHIIHMSQRSDFEVHRMVDNHRSDASICRTAVTLMEGSEFPAIIQSQTGGEGKVEVRGFKSPGQEIFGIGNEAQSRHQASGSVAILLRTNALVSEWTNTLKSLGVPIRVRKTRSQPSDWRRAIDGLSFVVNPSNDRLAYNVLVKALGEPAAKEKRTEAMIEFSSINQVSYKLPSNMLATQAVEWMRSSLQLGHDSTSMIERVAKDIPEGDFGPATAADLLVALSYVEFQSDDGQEGVVISTLHSAKGLEFDDVFLPAFEQEIIPGKREDTDIEEECRLAYVGITRARHTLVISHSEQRVNPWDKSMRKATPSQFIAEAFKG